MISVIIPVFDERDNLKRLLPRLRTLSLGHKVEIIVSVGECSINYKACFNGLANVQFVSDKRKGRAHQMNYGALRAKGDVLVFLHADVFPPEGFFEDMERTLKSGYDAGFFSYQFDKDSFLLRINASFTKKDGLFTGGGDQCLFIRKSIFSDLSNSEFRSTKSKPTNCTLEILSLSKASATIATLEVVTNIPAKSCSSPTFFNRNCSKFD